MGFLQCDQLPPGYNEVTVAVIEESLPVVNDKFPHGVDTVGQFDLFKGDKRIHLQNLETSNRTTVLPINLRHK